jgi:hypothetical protein
MSHRNLIERKHAAEAQRFDCNLIEIKLAAGDGTTTAEMVFSGYGAVFGNVDSYGDVIQKGAFRDTLREAKKSDNWPAMLMQHGGWGMGADDMTPVGIWTSMEEDDIGLKVEGKLADTARGREAYGLLKMTPRPAITGMSIGYMAKEFILGTKPEEPRRTLKKVDLMEVSLVTFPANGKARVQSVKTDMNIRIAEQALRDVGYSQKEAKAILAQGYKAIPQRDAEDYGELAEMIRRNTAILNP